jgi:hypothetical protein
MTKFAIIAGLVFSMGACKKDKWEAAISETEGFKDKMCACKDKACTEDVHKQYKEWEKGMADKFKEGDKPSDSVMERAEKVEKEMKECRKKFRDEGGGDHAAPAPGGEAPPAAPAPAPAGSAAP